MGEYDVDVTERLCDVGAALAGLRLEQMFGSFFECNRLEHVGLFTVLVVVLPQAGLE